VQPDIRELLDILFDSGYTTDATDMGRCITNNIRTVEDGCRDNVLGLLCRRAIKLFDTHGGTFLGTRFFQTALEDNNKSAARVLIDNGGCITVGDNYPNPLIFAVSYMNADDTMYWIKLLVEAGADWRKPDEYGNYATHIIASGGLISAAQYAFATDGFYTHNRVSGSRILPPMHTDALGRTPLHEAIGNFRSDMATYLWRHCNCSVVCEDVYGSTPLHMAAVRGMNGFIEDVVSTLPSLAFAVDGSGETLLDSAMSAMESSDRDSMVHFLVEVMESPGSELSN
jgi:hypothetical protein